ncbi:hypothetical protein [Pseudogemmobacter sonorensis]|uniref:hypothetical protein n=1 Tax=Pseudogemmobacter sonorensis TaxID=2989681 RepID=UPI0036784921
MTVLACPAGGAFAIQSPSRPPPCFRHIWKSPLDLKQFEAFAAVISTGSITAAARKPERS